MSNKKEKKLIKYPITECVNDANIFGRKFNSRRSKKGLHSHISPIQHAGETPKPSTIKKKEVESN